VGTFVADDVLDGCLIIVRFRWSRTDTPHPRWRWRHLGDQLGDDVHPPVTGRATADAPHRLGRLSGG
jgi:hypothetical protein